MAENLYNKAHKTSTPAYRKNWDKIQWDDLPEEKSKAKAREKPPIIVFDESVHKYLEKPTQREIVNIHE